MMSAESRIIDNKYRIVEEIAQGDLGPVYQAVEVESGEVCTLRFFIREHQSDGSMMTLLAQEAASVEKLHHPYIMPLGEVRETEDGRTYAVRPFAEGRTLADLLRLEGRLSLRRACRIGRQIASALEAAHNAGILHGNLQPAKVLLTGDNEKGLVRVLGFGTFSLKQSCFLDMARLALGEPQHLFGSPEYISPELATGTEAKTLDGRSDIYSLGVMLYEMLAGETPFHGKNTMELLLAHLFDDPPPLRDRPGLEIPEVLDTLVMRAMAKNRKDRPASATVLVDQLRPWEEFEAPAVSPATEDANSAAVIQGSTVREASAVPESSTFGSFHPETSTPSPIPAGATPFQREDEGAGIFTNPRASNRQGPLPDINLGDVTLPVEVAQASASPPKLASPELATSAGSHPDFEPDLPGPVTPVTESQKTVDITLGKPVSMTMPQGGVIFAHRLPPKQIPHKSRHPVWLAAIVVILIVLGGGSGWLYYTGRTYWFQPQYVMKRISSFVRSEVPPKSSTPQPKPPAVSAPPASSSPTPSHSSRARSSSHTLLLYSPPSLHPSSARTALPSASLDPTRESNSALPAQTPATAALANGPGKPALPGVTENESAAIQDVLRRGNYDFLLGKYDDAIRLYQNALKQNPSNPKLLAGIARARKAKVAEAEFLGH